MNWFTHVTEKATKEAIEESDCCEHVAVGDRVRTIRVIFIKHKFTTTFGDRGVVTRG